MTYKLNHDHVRDVIKLLQIDNLQLDLSDWIKDEWGYTMNERGYPRVHATKDHCGTTGCVLGHMYIAGMVDNLGMSYSNFTLLGDYFIDSDIHDNDIRYTIGEFIGMASSYKKSPNEVSVDMVVDRLRGLLKYSHVKCIPAGDDLKFVNLPDEKLGLTFNGQ